MKTTSSGPAGVKVLHKAVDVLEALGANAEALALADIASAVEMPKPTVYRIVATLESRGYVARTSDGRYGLSRRIFELQPDETAEQQVIRAARPVMEKLIAACRETLNLGMLDCGDVVVIETIESPLAVRMSSRIGNRRHPHSTALGKVLLAALPERDALRILRSRKMPKFTSHTITGQRQFLVELERVRQQGYAFDNCENEPDGRCVAAPIFGPHRRVLAAMSISGPLPRMTVTKAKSFLKPLCSACGNISSALGAER
jgi:DNA-binding IclR family transcriptional regulator